MLYETLHVPPGYNCSSSGGKNAERPCFVLQHRLDNLPLSGNIRLLGIREPSLREPVAGPLPPSSSVDSSHRQYLCCSATDFFDGGTHPWTFLRSSLYFGLATSVSSPVCFGPPSAGLSTALLRVDRRQIRGRHAGKLLTEEPGSSTCSPLLVCCHHNPHCRHVPVHTRFDSNSGSLRIYSYGLHFALHLPHHRFQASLENTSVLVAMHASRHFLCYFSRSSCWSSSSADNRRFRLQAICRCMRRVPSHSKKQCPIHLHLHSPE